MSVEKLVGKSKADVTVVFKDGMEIKSRIRQIENGALRSKGLSVFFCLLMGLNVVEKRVILLSKQWCFINTQTRYYEC